MVDFGNKLKELRLNYGLTQKQLSEHLGITKSVVSYYELSERCPSPEMLVKIADYFHITTDYLLGKEKKSQSISIDGLTDKQISIINELINEFKINNTKNLR